jgi:uncharacterized protein YbjT (DUF2867 family)
MAIIVNTPGGNIGRPLTGFLLDAGADVTIISRNPDRDADLVGRGAKLTQGSLDDPATLREAMQGAGSLFWLTPPNFQPDFQDWACQSAERAIALAKEAGIVRFVVLSSVGAHSGPGAGPVSLLGEVEKIFLSQCDNCVVMRPAYFMENWLHHLPTVAKDNAVFLPLPPEKSLPMVATRDIANLAASVLLDDAWTGQRFLGVHGPEDLTHLRATEIISAELGRTVTYVEITMDQMRQALLAMGTPDFVVDMYLELYQAMSDGRLDSAEPRTAETTTPTSLAQFTREVIKPMLAREAEAQGGS